MAQTITYETSLSSCILIFVGVTGTFDLVEIAETTRLIKIFLFFPFFLLIWGLVCLIERNRTPFDLAEGESELVSGFNTEYTGGLFTLIFLSEYIVILIIRILILNPILGNNWL